MLNKSPTSYPEINPVIATLAEGIADVLKSKVIGIYLFGSLSYGDFNLESSDIDLMVILKDPASDSEVESLKSLHKSVERKFPRWAGRIESSYTPQNMLRSVAPPGARPYCGEGIFYPAADYGNEWIINLYLLYNHGISVFGPKFGELVSQVDIKDVQKASKLDLFKEWEPKLREPEWLNNPHYQSYLVLNLCRILNTVSNAQVVSKKKSADWVKNQYPEWSELIEKAEKWQYGQTMDQKKETLAFLRFVIGKVKTN